MGGVSAVVALVAFVVVGRVDRGDGGDWRNSMGDSGICVCAWKLC